MDVRSGAQELDYGGGVSQLDGALPSFWPTCADHEPDFFERVDVAGYDRRAAQVESAP